MLSSKNVLGKYLNEHFWVKNSIFDDFKVNKCRKPSVFGAAFVYSGWHGGLFDSFNTLHHYPLPGHSPTPKSRHTKKAIYEPTSLSLALSKWRHRTVNYGRGMTSTLPLSYWSPGESNMTSSHTATHFFIAIQIRVNLTVLGGKLNSQTWIWSQGFRGIMDEF